MERLSDNAIEIINALHTEKLDYNSEYLPLIEAANHLAAYENTGLTPEKIAILREQEQSGWISVNDRLPEDDERNKFHTDGILSMTSVLVYDKFRYVHIANRLKVDPCGNEYLDEHSTVGWVWSNNCKDITHWMPLPEPPKEG